MAGNARRQVAVSRSRSRLRSALLPTGRPLGRIILPVCRPGTHDGSLLRTRSVDRCAEGVAVPSVGWAWPCEALRVHGRVMVSRDTGLVRWSSRLRWWLDQVRRPLRRYPAHPRRGARDRCRACRCHGQPNGGEPLRGRPTSGLWPASPPGPSEGRRCRGRSPCVRHRDSHGEATSSRARACHASAFPCASSADPHRSTQASTLALWGRGHRRPADARVRPCGRGEVWYPRGQVRQESEPWGGLRGPRTARPMWQMAKGTRGSNSMMGHAAPRGLVRARCTCGGGKS